MVCAVLLGEFQARLIGLGTPVVYEHNAAFGYTLAPNQNVTRLRNANIIINESGLRSDKTWETENNNKIKILFLGDSVTYGGSYIDNSQLFTSQICGDLGDKFICGNAGVNSYGVLNIALRSRYDSRVQDANIVIFTFVLSDFLRGLQNSSVAHYYLSPPNRWMPGLEESLNFLEPVSNMHHMLKERLPWRLTM